MKFHLDYTASVVEVFTQVTRAFYSTYGNLEPLREGKHWIVSGHHLRRQIGCGQAAYGMLLAVFVSLFGR
jgi:hypothetical protein